MVSVLTFTFAIQARPEREIPPAFGPYINLKPRDFAESKSFKKGDRVVGTYYFYWYCTETKEHIVNPEDGSDGLTDHPPSLEDFSYKSVRWHKKQLSDMMDAGMDIALMVFWGAPSERDKKASLYWSYAGLGPLVAAREELLREGKKPPCLGLFYDTSTLQYNAWNQHIDLTTDYGKRWFYATIRDFFSALPPKHWAMIEGKPVVLMYAAAFVKNHDQSFIDFAKAEFKREFNGREPYIAPQDSWHAKGDNVCAWGGALGLRNPGIGELGPGYNDTAVYGRKPLIADRKGGKFYEDNWLKFLRRPSDLVMVETWSEFHEGTEICETKEYGRQYIELTRKYSDLFKKGWTPPWPNGPFTGVKAVSAAPLHNPEPAGLILLTPEDGKFAVTKEAGRDSWRSKTATKGSSYFYFKIDDSFKWAQSMNASVEVEYLDAVPGMLGIEFDGSDLAAPLRGAYSCSEKIRLAGEHQWKQATFKLNGCYFLNSQNGQADFRIVAESPQFAVGKVTLSRQ
jgi:hypothetical protein